MQGFRFCDLLLSLEKYQEVLDRARTTVNIAQAEKWLLYIALDQLTIGKALMLLENFSEAPVPSYVEAEDYLKQAVDGLWKAGIQDILPRGLIARAALYRYKEEFIKSWEDIDESKQIAEYGQMKLHLTDYHLEACRVIKVQLVKTATNYEIIEDGETLSLTKEQMEARFKEHFKEAERLIQDTGYHRRDKELEELREFLLQI